jgi:CO dehydrogenase maturation factor
VLALNRCPNEPELPQLPGLPPLAAVIPPLAGLGRRQLTDGSVLGLPELPMLGPLCGRILDALSP